MFRFKWEDEPRVVTSSPTAAIKVRSLPASSPHRLMADRYRQATGHSALRGFAQALDRRAHAHLEQPVPPPRTRLRVSPPQSCRFVASR